MEKINLWSSKFILPEHREAMIAYDRESRRKIKPNLDEQEKTAIEQQLHASFYSRTPICLKVFGDYEDRYVQGVVIHMEPRLDYVKVALDNESWELIPFSAILGVE
ncbi:YolD-like family protein [Paenibacillus tuaregi]|uniref:YolD-like family protein n=1 Tax=Paenibacillus tuaregi TaxID=1816681 RepID=UPI0009ED31A0|nr:YolD-like family protein [Paenibacillus tuaregi]